ncbi:MAG TPA: carboxypeptidase-like regulatory domain-containing protein [Niabella sp.]
MNKHCFQRLFTGLLLFIFLANGLAAQNSGSSISGFVFNDSNQVLSSATVIVKNTHTGFTTSTVTNTTGYFGLSDLPVGTYDITISSIGYQPMNLPGNALNLGDRLVLRKIILSQKAGELSNVTVVSNSFKNSIDRLGTATAISSRTMQKLPLSSRNYTELTSLSPLASGSSSLAGAKAGEPGTSWMV